MAELGTINFTDVNRGTNRVDRTAEVQALSQALNTGKQLVDEGVKAKVTKNMQEAILDTATEDPLALRQDVTTETAVEDPRTAKLKSDLDRWKLLASQGNSSQRTLAEIRIKEILNQAQANYPWLAEDLQQRAGVVMAGSAELEKLGLYDAARATQAKAAQSQIDEIQQYATKKWEDGGLGISPHLQVGSQEWLAQYIDYDSMRAEQQKNARVVGLTISNAEATATELEDAAASSLQGQFSAARAGRYAIFTDNGFNEALREVQKGDSGNLEVIRQFHGTAVPIIIDNLEQQKIEAIQLYEVYFAGRLAGTEAGKRVRSQLNDYITEQDSIISKFKSSVDELPSAIEQIDALNKIRGAEVMRTLTTPNQNFVAFINGPGKGLIELAGLAKTADGLVTANKLGVQAVGILQSKFPDFLGDGATPSNRQVSAFMTTGQGTISTDMTGQDINKRLDKIHSDSSSPWYIRTATDKDELEAAYWSVDNHKRLWDAALTVPDKYATPEMAAQYLTGINNSLRTFNSIDEKPKDVYEVITTSLADDRLLTAIDTVGDNPDVVAQRRAFGMSAKEWYVSTNPSKRQAQVASTYNSTKIGGVPLNELARVDISSMSTEGEFNYVINEPSFKRAVESRLELARGFARDSQEDVLTPNRAQVENEIREEIVNTMAPIALEVTQSLSINRNLDHATAVSVDARRRSNVKLQFYNDLGWLDIFNYADK